MQQSLETKAGLKPCEEDQGTACRCRSIDGNGPVLLEFLARVVASAYEIEPILMFSPSRGNAHVALARQVAMYVSHVSCGLTLTEVGRQFNRDRTTVAHACEVVEERREDVPFDQMIGLLEDAVEMLRSNSGEVR